MKREFALVCVLLFYGIARAQNIAPYIDSTLSKYNIPEMAVAVVTDDSIIVSLVKGHHKLTEQNDAPTAKQDDYFHLGSNTKAITGFIAARLVDQKKIDWNTKFFDLFPEWKEKSDSGYYEITLLDLLTHTARIKPFTSGVEYMKLPKFDGTTQDKRTSFVKHTLTLKPVKEAAPYTYSNAGYSVAALMLEKVSEKSWENLVKEHIHEKMKLNPVFGWPNRNFQNQPWGHWKPLLKLKPVGPETDYSLAFAEPAGDLSLTINDYAKFIRINLMGLSGKDTLLNSTTWKFLHTAKNGYAIGWGNRTKDDKEISEHAGSDGTFFAYTQIDRKNNIAYIVLVNSATKEAQEGVRQTIGMLKSNYGIR